MIAALVAAAVALPPVNAGFDYQIGRRDTIAYARRLVRAAHRHGLAAAQKNAPQLRRVLRRARTAH